MSGICRYKYVQGPKKGHFCNKPCRDSNRCKMHKKTNIARRKEYYRENRSIITQINNCTDINELPSLNELVQKKELYFTDYVFKTKKLIGYKLEQGINQDEEIKQLKELVKGKCICSKKCVVGPEEIEEYRSQYNNVSHEFPNKFDPTASGEIIMVSDMNDDQISSLISNRYRCSKCENFDNDKCRFCNTGYIPYFECKRKVDDKKIRALEKKIDILYKKMEQKKKIIIAIKEVTNKLKNIN